RSVCDSPVKARIAIFSAFALTSCGEPAGPPTVPYDSLSQYGFFVGPLADQKPAAGVVAYDVNSALFADGAGKFRFIAIPANTKAHFDATGRWTYPDGTFLIKTFYFDNDARNPAAGRRLLATRLLINMGGTWSAQTYLWNDAQTDAARFVAGKS